MTSAGLEQQLIPIPFAHNGLITDIVIGTSDSTPSFDDGFPAAFSAPRSGGGEYVLRGMMNAIGNLASKNEYYRQAGGLYQFNAEWARLNNGYAKGAVLDYLDGNKLYKVISLVDNNKVDYTQSTHTVAQTTAGIISGGIDGVHWAYCNVATTVSYNEICDVPNFTWPYKEENGSDFSLSDMFPIGYFIAPRNGVLTVIGSCNFTADKALHPTEGTDPYRYTGFAILVCSHQTTAGKIDNPAEYKADMIFARGDYQEEFQAEGVEDPIPYSSEQQCALQVTQGTKYQIYIANYCGNITNSTLKVVLI